MAKTRPAGGQRNRSPHAQKERGKLPFGGCRQRESVDSCRARTTQGCSTFTHRRARRKNVVHEQQVPPRHHPGIRSEFPQNIVCPFKSVQSNLGPGCPEPLDSPVQHRRTGTSRQTCRQQRGLIVASLQQPVLVQGDRYKSIHLTQNGRPGVRGDQSPQIACQDRSQFQSAVILESMDGRLKRPFVQRGHTYTTQRILASGARIPEPQCISGQLKTASPAKLPRRGRPHLLRTVVAEPLAASRAVYATGREDQVEQAGTESLKQCEDGPVAMPARC